jgi:uncharacterized protein YjiS (DUF1127 family)
MLSHARRLPERRERHATPPVGVLHGAARRLVQALLEWHELAQQRRRLLALDDRMLKDIGISRADAVREAARPFWDTPGIDGARWP